MRLVFEPKTSRIDQSELVNVLLARDARMKLGYLDLWRAWHGAPLHIRDLEAASLDALLERREDGRASTRRRARVRLLSV